MNFYIDFDTNSFQELTDPKAIEHFRVLEGLQDPATQKTQCYNYQKKKRKKKEAKLHEERFQITRQHV